MRSLDSDFRRILALAGVVVLVWALPASADWSPGDGHKMHFPQLPDDEGWDVEIASIGPQHELADDWQCSATGPVEDIHFWLSFQGDQVHPINYLVLTIYDNVPADPGIPGSFSQPGSALWTREFVDLAGFPLAGPFPAGPMGQGFADPQQGSWVPGEHVEYWQFNITQIADPFIQQQGQIYWLGVYVWWEGTGASVGWKTTLDPFMDQAVFRPLTDCVSSLTHVCADGITACVTDADCTAPTAPPCTGVCPGNCPIPAQNCTLGFTPGGTADYCQCDPALWQPLFDPTAVPAPVPLDLAFVITGQPPSVPMTSQVGLVALTVLLLAGLTFVVWRRRRNPGT